jgi:hypothetical protein
MSHPLRELEPEEVSEIKGQIAVLLNYSSPGNAPARIKPKHPQKVEFEDIELIRNRVDVLLGLIPNTPE